MDDSIGAAHQLIERDGIGKATLHPLDTAARLLIAPGKRFNRNTGQRIKHCMADKARRAGYGQLHPRTIWSRWTTAARGA